MTVEGNVKLIRKGHIREKNINFMYIYKIHANILKYSKKTIKLKQKYYIQSNVT